MQTNKTIRKRKDSGKWQAIIKQKQGNKWKQVESKTFVKKIEADQRANKKVAEWQKKMPSDYDSMTVGQLKELYLSYLEHNVKYSSLQTIKYQLQRAKDFDDRIVSSIKPHEYQAFNQSHTESNILRMRSFYNYLIKNLKLDISNDFYTSKSKIKAAKPLTKSEFNRLKKYIKNEEYLLAIEIGYYTGLRIAEVCGLTYDVITPTTLTVNKQWSLYSLDFTTPKSERGYRTIPLKKEIYKKIIDHRNQKKYTSINYKLFDAKRTQKSIQIYIKKNLINTEFEGITFHDLRHSFITNLIQKNVDVQTVAYLAGDKVQTIIDNYIHINTDTSELAIKAINSL